MSFPDVTVLYVDASDEITTVLQAVRQAEGERVVLVLPERPRVFRNDVNLRLLDSYSRESGKRVTLVCGDTLARQVAERQGLVAFPSLAEFWEYEARRRGLSSAPPAESPPPRLKASALARPADAAATRQEATAGSRLWLDRWLAAALAAAGIGLAVFAYTPKVVVRVEPAVLVRQEHVEWPLAPDGSGPAEAGMVRWVEGRAEVAQEFATTGLRRVGVEAARARVVFINEGRTPVRVPSGTVVSTPSGQRFRTVETVTVPGLTAQYLADVPVAYAAGRSEVEVVAAEPGTGGNVGAGRIRVVAGGLAGKVKVVNPAPATGGADRQVAVVSTADVERARQAMERLARERLQAQLVAGLQPGERLAGGLVVTEPLRLELQPKLGSEAPSFRAVASLGGRVLVVRDDLVRQRVAQQLHAQVPAGFAIAGSGPQVTEVTAIRRGDRWYLQVSAQVTLVGQPDGTALARALVGVERGEAERILASTPGVGRFQLPDSSKERLPGWSPWLRVDVRPPSAPTSRAAPAEAGR